MKFSCLVAFCALLPHITAEPLVTLSHGGQLQGKSITFNNTQVDLFLGVPYAQPPVGLLRFQKPNPPDAWTGVRNATTYGATCPQLSMDFSGSGKRDVFGDEDCLLLDISIPEGVADGKLKPVMVWIHGGNYILGSKHFYFGAPLAVSGDVIVVSINYRLDVLGFLSDGKPGTGNYGLWDQRAALVWVKDNIKKFGGDPDLVTIFGESAGAGSVSSQVMGRYNEGLFKRAIQESGSLYTPWTWFKSTNQRYKHTENLKTKSNCSKEMTIFECFADMPVKELLPTAASDDLLVNYWHPAPDDDFFEADVQQESYLLSKRYDVLIGFNGQEGLGWLSAFQASNMTFENGITKEEVRIIIGQQCEMMTPLSVELCAEFIIDLYQLHSTDSDKERAKMLTYYFGETSFNSDAVKELVEHSTGTKKTYAYTFTKIQEFRPGTTGFSPPAPEYLKKSADHGEELVYVWGSEYITESKLWDVYFGDDLPEDALPMIDFYNNTVNVSRSLTDSMMTMWTNFARSGNPNEPVALPAGVPEWPEFDTNTNQFMELGDDIRVITTPNKERLESLSTDLYPARQAQVLADKAPYEYNAASDCEVLPKSTIKTVKDNAASKLSISSVSIALLTVIISL